MPTAKCNSENPPTAQPLGLLEDRAGGQQCPGMLGGKSGQAPRLHPRYSRCPAEYDCSLPQAGEAETFSTHGPAVAVLGNIWLEEKLHSGCGTPLSQLVSLPGKQAAALPDVSPPEHLPTILHWQESCLPQSTGDFKHILKNKITD